jgi:hypothetical protein
MRRHAKHSWLTLSLLALLGACFGGDRDTGPIDDTSHDSTAGDLLTDAHDGWRDPSCWGCHDTATTHNASLDPYQCVTCHGSNGASGGHTDVTPCAECHQQPHAVAGFPDPESCLVCHP